MNPYESAQTYAHSRGFAVFPVHGIKTVLGNGEKLNTCTCGIVECGSPGKHPATPKGRNAASKIQTVIENLWAARGHLNVAVATGIESGIFVVDVDGVIGEESLKTLEDTHGYLPKTLVSITGRGKHYIFKYPAKKVFNRTNCLGKSIDVRGDGGYICVPPSKHISGVNYQWEDDSVEVCQAPEWLLEMVCAQAKAPVVNESVLNFDSQKNDWKSDDIASMLDYLDPDMGYSEWINIGMAIQASGFSFELWDSWSKRSSKYDGSTGFHWKSFRDTGGITIGTLVQAAQIRGWKPEGYVVEKLDWESHPARDWLKKIGAYTPPVDKHAVPKTIKEIIKEPGNVYTGFPVDCENMPGFIGETVRWITNTAVKPQPELALYNTLVALGAVFGRRYASPINTRTNLFLCGLAPTGKGKDHSRKQLKNIMTSAGLEDFLASDDIKSGAGMLTTLSKKPSCIMMLDEFGLVLQSIVGDKAAAHRQDIGAMFLKIYTSSGGVYTAGDYADKKAETIVLKDPHLCIYGTSTLENYILALKKIAIHGGDLARFIVLPGRDRPKLMDHDIDREIPDHLLEMWKTLIPQGNGLSALNNILIEPPVTEVGWGDTKEYFRKLLHTEDTRVDAGKKAGTGALWTRYREHVIKLAMIFAIVQNPHNPKMSFDSDKFPGVETAEKIVSASVEYVIDLASNYMFENELERSKKSVLAIIRGGGESGATRKEIMRGISVTSKQFDDLIKALIDEERIEAQAEGKTKVVYRYL